MLPLIAHTGALLACVAAAALLPRWRSPRGPLLEMALLTGLLGLVVASWVQSSTVIAIVLAYTFVRAQQLLVQPTEVAATQSRPSWGFDPRAAARGLHLVPFVGAAMFATLPGAAHRLTISDLFGPFLSGLMVLTNSRIALHIAVLSAVSAGLAVYL